ncbi:hypothetical protein KUL118_67340 [Tenacibaculum sp. KUL118]|nr:hypothetical protein KUL118_67340 [Tenacibaculum sp. KUL118]
MRYLLMLFLAILPLGCKKITPEKIHQKQEDNVVLKSKGIQEGDSLIADIKFIKKY